ncbi:MAG: glycerophosphodiester phosphodiesterase [Sulfurovum sp.]|nr:glycerophosphodiester phosphodiesterase [Sulfurovum sp.]
MERTNNKPLIVAHRGGASTKALENTIEAFKKAFEDAADAIEGDFHLTKDGVIVCTHDYDIEGLVIKESSFSELKALKPQLPTLQDVLELITDDKIIYIEIKCGVEIFPSLVSVLQLSNVEHSQIVIISFNADVIKESEILFPEIKTYWLCYLKAKEVPDVERCINVLKSSQADGLSTTMNTHVNERLIKALHTNGFSYHAWTVNSVEDAKALLKWGTASITTDKVVEIREGVFSKNMSI